MTVFSNKLAAIKEYKNNIYAYAFEAVIDNEDFIVELITEEQLFEQGIRGDETFIADYAPYSPFTVQMKQLKGQPTDRVTLKDEGDFYRSFFIKVGSDHFEVMASDSKTEKLVREYGEEIMQFTDENLSEVIWSYIYPALIFKLKEMLAR